MCKVEAVICHRTFYSNCFYTYLQPIHAYMRCALPSTPTCVSPKCPDETFSPATRNAA